MAALFFVVNSGEVTLAASVTTTLLQIKAPANQALRIKSINVWGKQPAGGVDTPVKIRLTRSTASFGTGTAATPGKTDPGRGETIQSTCYAAPFSTAPTTPTDTGIWMEVQPQTAAFYPVPFGQDLIIPGGAAINVEAITITGQTPTLVAVATVEE
jgi:hypothetical protein